ncbi:MAG: A24 family peptidase [Thermodesulfobacteriota bacterium]|nr:A24 family peptidase [Thermodesulfobacteriota bacterium]
MLPITLVKLFIFVFGASIGSFLNVCIYRLPAGKSIVTPPSACPKCDYQIRFYDNVPVISYLLLRGQCRNCSAHIPIRYPMVEILTGLAALAAYLKAGLTPEGGVLFVFIAALIVVIFIDIDHQIIPDVITLPGIVLCFLAAVFILDLGVVGALIGLLAGGGSLLLVASTYKALTGVDGMGGGDIKLLAMIGALTGWQGVFFTILTGSAAGTLVGGILMAFQKKNMKFAVPFGPFLSLGAILYLFFGEEIFYWYLRTLGH